jgi:hypothetical protein
MAGSAIALVISLGVNAVQLPHAEREVPFRRFDEEMIVVVHETIGMADPMIALVDTCEDPEECFTVAVVLENVLLLVSPGGNMINGAWIFDS